MIALLVIASTSNVFAAEQKALSQSQVTRAVEAEECDVEAKEAFENQRVFPLDANHKLVDISCGRAAYNYDSIYFLVTGGDVKSVRRLEFKMWDGKTFVPSTALTDGRHDAKTRILGSFDKGRGFCDCGKIGEWAWDGKTFQVKGYWRKDQCDGEQFDSSDKSKWRVFPPR